MAIDWDGLVLGPVVNVFAEAVTYAPASGAAYTTQGVFTEGFQVVTLLEDGSSITGEQPRLGVRLADLSAAPLQGDAITIRGTTYSVNEVRLDSHGRADLMLNYLSG